MLAVPLALVLAWVLTMCYGPELDNINSQLDDVNSSLSDLQTRLTALETQVAAGATVTGISTTTSCPNGGYSIALSKTPSGASSSTIEICNGTNGTNGVNGANGKDGNMWYIGNDGYWHMNYTNPTTGASQDSIATYTNGDTIHANSMPPVVIPGKSGGYFWAFQEWNNAAQKYDTIQTKYMVLDSTSVYFADMNDYYELYAHVLKAPTTDSVFVWQTIKLPKYDNSISLYFKGFGHIIGDSILQMNPDNDNTGIQINYWTGNALNGTGPGIVDGNPWYGSWSVPQPPTGFHSNLDEDTVVAVFSSNKGWSVFGDQKPLQLKNSRSQALSISLQIDTALMKDQLMTKALPADTFYYARLQGGSESDFTSFGANKVYYFLSVDTFRSTDAYTIFAAKRQFANGSSHKLGIKLYDDGGTAMENAPLGDTLYRFSLAPGKYSLEMDSLNTGELSAFYLRDTIEDDIPASAYAFSYGQDTLRVMGTAGDEFMFYVERSLWDGTAYLDSIKVTVQ
jgi:hypothetical protein